MSKIALICAGAGAAVTAAYFALRPKEEKETGVEEIPEVTPDELVQIFTKLFLFMNQNISDVMRRISAQNAQIPQQVLAQHLTEHFETQLKAYQSEVFEFHGYDDDDVEEAVEYYEKAKHEGVCDAVNQLRQLYINVGGSVELDIPEELTVEKMCQIYEEYMGAVVSAQAAFTAHLHVIKAKGTSVKSCELDATRHAFLQEKVHAMLRTHGISILIFQAAIEKYNNHPRFQANVAALKQKDAAGAKQLA